MAKTDVFQIYSVSSCRVDENDREEYEKPSRKKTTKTHKADSQILTSLRTNQTRVQKPVLNENSACLTLNFAAFVPAGRAIPQLTAVVCYQR